MSCILRIIEWLLAHMLQVISCCCWSSKLSGDLILYLYVSGFGSSFSYLIRVWSVLWSSLVEVFIGFAWQEPGTGGSRSQSVGAGLNDLSWSRNLHLESKNLNDEPAENNPEIFTPGGLPLLLPHYDTSKRHAKETNKITKTQPLSHVSF